MQFVGILGTIAGNLCHAITAHGFESLAILNFSGFVFATAIESLFHSSNIFFICSLFHLHPPWVCYKVRGSIKAINNGAGLPSYITRRVATK